MQEIWKDIPDVPGPACQVSNFGRVRQKEKVIAGYKQSNVLRKPSGSDGRKYLAFYDPETRQQLNRYVARLVAAAFLEPEGTCKQVGFRNGFSLAASNLYWK